MDERALLVVVQILFVGTGLIKGFGFQLLSVGDSSMEWTLFVAALPFVGPLMVCFIVMRTALFSRMTWRLWGRLFFISFVDVVGTCLNFSSYRFVGLGVVSIICAGMPAVTSILAFLWDRKLPSATKTLAILGAFFGLSIVPLTGDGNLMIGSSMLIGSGLCGLATVLNSAVYLMMERTVAQDEPELFVLFWQALNGAFLIGSILGVRFLWSGGIPSTFMSHFHELNFGLPSLLMGGTVQSFCWIHLLSTVGSVTTGLLQIVRSRLAATKKCCLFFTKSKYSCSSVCLLVVFYSNMALHNASKRSQCDSCDGFCGSVSDIKMKFSFSNNWNVWRSRCLLSPSSDKCCLLTVERDRISLLFRQSKKHTSNKNLPLFEFLPQSFRALADVPPTTI
jgi:drug/metabolite transporter (DMT)-like permease